MRAGRLRHRLTIQELIETQDTFGATVETWTDVAEVWGSVEPLRGTERFMAQQLKPELAHMIEMRYLEVIQPKMRVLYSRRVMDIDSVIDVKGHHREMQLLVTEFI